MTQENAHKIAAVPDKKAEEKGARLAVSLSSVMSALMRVMEDENRCLKRRDMNTLKNLQSEKAKWMREYRGVMNSLAATPSALAGLEDAEREKLKGIGKAFSAIGGENVALFKAAVLATQSLVQMVMDNAREHNKTSPCYADPRKTPLMLGSYSPVCDPMAVNRTA